VSKTFAADTEYTAILTLSPVDKKYTFEGIDLTSIAGLPQDGVKTFENRGKELVIKIEFEKTGSVKAASQIVFSDEFDGTTLNTGKWDLCPEWDRQGRSSWRDDMVSVSGGFLRLKFKRDPQLGALKSNNKTLADNWIRAGAVRTSKKDRSILFDHTYGYYEARIKFPVVSGTWGAFWLMSPTQHFTGDEGKDGTEIDIVESIHNQRGEYNAALHWNGYENNHKSAGSAERPVNIYDGEFHIFALDWSPSEYIFYIDGVEFWRVDGGSKFQNAGINQNPNYIKLTVESAPWAGDIPSNFSEGEMLVDYVRVYNQPKP
jgi:beta-glucanase (GH16 family)